MKYVTSFYNYNNVFHDSTKESQLEWLRTYNN